MDKKVYKYEEDLVLRDLKLEQSGQYYCKTSSSAGSIKSAPSFLTVIGVYTYSLSMLVEFLKGTIHFFFFLNHAF